MKTIYYFSQCFKELAKYSKAWSEIEPALQSQNEAYGFISCARDIWARDFMPFQRHDGEFVIYNYNPDYLQGGQSKYITDCQEAFRGIGGNPDALNCHQTNLVIDGGNMIKCWDKKGMPCVLMTAKVLYENPDLSHHEILSKLENVLDAEVIIIPWDVADMFGHADGMVRSVGKGRLLLNCYFDMDSGFEKVLKKALKNRFELHELHYGDKFRENSWCHLNYLELHHAVLVPTASLASDRLALAQIEEIIGKKCIPIPMASVVADGGAMHCVSWSMDAPDVLLDGNAIPLHRE